MVSFNISSDARRVELTFEEFPQRARSALLARITDITDRLYAEVIAAEPQATGKLRRETLRRVSEAENRITGRVFVSAEFAKAGALEYGAHRTVAVKAHSERRSIIFGRYVAPFTEAVAAYSRRENIAEHRFLRGPFEADRETITRELQAALDEAMPKE